MQAFCVSIHARVSGAVLIFQPAVGIAHHDAVNCFFHFFHTRRRWALHLIVLSHGGRGARRNNCDCEQQEMGQLSFELKRWEENT